MFDERNGSVFYYPTDLAGNNSFKQRENNPPIWDSGCAFKKNKFPKHSIADLYLFMRTKRFTVSGDEATFK